MAVHVIQLENLDQQVEELVGILRKYEKQWKENNNELISHDLNAEIEALESFKQEFESLIRDSLENEQGVSLDIYGNNLSQDYKYAEITYSKTSKFDRIRLLGTDGVIKTRFYATELENNFSPTTVLLISNIRDIIQKPFNLKAFFDLCGQDFKKSNGTAIQENVKKEIKYTWEEVAERFFVPPAVVADVDEMTDESREKIRQKYKKPFLTKEEMTSRNRAIQQEKAALYKKSLQDKEEQKSLANEINKELQDLKKVKDYQVILNSIGKFVDKYSFSCLLKEAIECVKPNNISCETLFKDLSVTEIFDRLALVFPRGSDTFKQLEKLVEETLFGNVSQLRYEIDKLKKIVEGLEKQKQDLACTECDPQALETLDNAIEENKQKISDLENELKAEEERVYEDLMLSARQQELAKRGGNLFAIVSTATTDEEKAGLATNTDRILKAIDTIIPLEDLCGLLLQAISGSFDLTSFKFPTLRPVNDIFSGFSSEIQTAFLQAIVQAILFLIEAMLTDLFNCDNLDNVVAASVAGSNESFAALANLDFETAASNFSSKVAESSDKFGIYSDLVSLFGGSSPNVVASFEKNYDKFVDKVAPLFGNIASIKIENVIEGSTAETTSGIGQDLVRSILEKDFEQAEKNVVSGSVKDNLANFASSISSNRQGVFDYFLTQGGSQSTANWDIDTSGEKFIISDGITIFDINQIDKTIAESTTAFINSIPPDLLTEDALLLISKEQEEKIVFSNSPNSTNQALTVDRETIKKDTENVINSFVAIASPTEVINLMAGKASKETIRLVSEIVAIKSPSLSSVLNNQATIKNLFLQFGKATGLDKLLPQMNLLASTPEANLKLVPPKLCAPFNNVDTFRKALMNRVVPIETAEKIFDSINDEKIKRYNDLINNLLEITTGNIPSAIRSDPKTKFLDEIRSNVLIPSLKETETSLDRKQQRDRNDSRNIEDLMRKQMSEKAKSSPIYMSMVDTTLSSIFSPIRETFNSDMQGFIDSYSIKKEIEKEIPREIEIETKKGTLKTINPEFKDFLNAGLVPIVQEEDKIDSKVLKYAIMVNKTSLNVGDEGKLDDLRVSGNPNTDFTKPAWSLKRLVQDILSLGFEDPERVKKPILKTINKKIVGEDFKSNIDLGFKNNLNIYIDKNKFLVGIFDYESTNTALLDLSKNSELANTFDTLPALKQQIKEGIPKWTINFMESKEGQKEISRFGIESDGVSITTIKGFEDFYQPTTDIKKQFAIEQNSRQIIVDRFGSVDYPLKTRAEVFQDFFITQMKEGLIDFDTTAETTAREILLEKQKQMLRAVVNSITKSLVNTRLFEETDIGGQTADDKLVFLQLFDFARNPTEKEKECGFDPHIMGFDGLYEDFKKTYEEEPEVVQEEGRTNGLAKKRTRLGNAAYKVMIQTIIRLETVEFALKTLPVLDSFLYTNNFSKIEFLKDSLLNHTINDLKNMKIYEAFKREMKSEISKQEKIQNKNNYDELDLADCRDVQQVRDLATSTSTERTKKEQCKEKEIASSEAVAVGSALQTAIKKDREVSDEEFREVLKNKLQEQLTYVLEKLAEIFQVPSEERRQDQFKNFFIKGLSVYDVHEDSNPTFNSVIRNVVSTSKLNISDLSIKQQLREINDKNISGTEKALEVSKLLNQKNAAEFAGSFWTKETLTKLELKEEVAEGDLYLERYIRIGQLNPLIVDRYPQIKSLEHSIVKLATFTNTISEIEEDTILFNCDDPAKSLFVDSPRFGLRLNYVCEKYEAENSINDVMEKIGTFGIGINRYKVSNEFLKERKLSVTEEIGEKDLVKFVKVYSILTVAEQEQLLNINLTAGHLQRLSTVDNYNEIFYPILREKILRTREVSAMFDYCIPVKEISTIALFHTYLINNSEKQKYLFQPTKDTINKIFEILEDFGDKTKTSKKLSSLREKQKNEINNEGNPAGPANFEALKIFARTPIHILRGLATAVDPNIFIADKIVAGAAAAGSLMNQKIYVPYGLTSIALLPFPLFTPPPAGIIPPLTAYNIAMPLGPIFLALEPLLWDLPWFKSINGDPSNPSRDLSKYGIQNKDMCLEQNNGQKEGQEESATGQTLDADSIEQMLEQLKKIC